MVRLIIGFCTTILSLFFILFAFAQEDTARLIFKKRAPVSQKREVWEYTVKPNETLIIIVSRQLGIKKERLRFIYREVLPLNPGLKDVNFIRPGQKLYLPNLRREEGEAKEPMAHLNLDLIKTIVEKLGGSMSLTGQHTIPLGEAGQVTISCAQVPVADFPDGTVVMLDLKNRLQADLKNLIVKSWPNYRVVSALPNWDTVETLTHFINATTPAQSMIAVKSDLPLKSGLRLNIPSAWLITGPKKLLLYSTYPRDERLPPLISTLLEEQGLEVLEIKGEKIFPSETGKGPLPFDTLPRLHGETQEGFVTEIFNTLGLRPQPMKEISIFTPEEDGFSLSAPAISSLKRGGEMIVFTYHPLPTQFQNLLKKKAIRVFPLPMGNRSRTIKEIARILNLPYSDGWRTFDLSPPGYKKTFAVKFRSLFFPKTPNGPVHFIDFDLDERLYSFLKEKFGCRLVRY